MVIAILSVTTVLLSLVVVRLQSTVGELRNSLDAAEEEVRLSQEQIEALEREIAQARAGKERLESELGTAQDQLGQKQQQLDEATRSAQTAPPEPAAAQTPTASVVTIRSGRAEGSGFVLEGIPLPAGKGSAVVTNHHVIELGGSAKVSVRQGDTTFKATLGQVDRENDLALVYLNETLPALKWAARSGHVPKVGDAVTAIGTPNGRENTVSTGTISRVDRHQVKSTAALAPGSSGGPLLNAQGEVIAVNTSIDSGAGTTSFSVLLELLCDQLVSC